MISKTDVETIEFEKVRISRSSWVETDGIGFPPASNEPYRQLSFELLLRQIVL